MEQTDEAAGTEIAGRNPRLESDQEPAPVEQAGPPEVLEQLEAPRAEQPQEAELSHEHRDDIVGEAPVSELSGLMASEAVEEAGAEDCSASRRQIPSPETRRSTNDAATDDPGRSPSGNVQ